MWGTDTEIACGLSGLQCAPCKEYTKAQIHNGQPIDFTARVTNYLVHLLFFEYI